MAEETPLARPQSFFPSPPNVYICSLGRWGLAESMSHYLIRRIEENPKIELRTHTEIVELKGEGHLESVRWRNNKTGETEEHHIRNVFVMAGAAPNTIWLNGCVALDSKGFIKTGPQSFA